MVNLLLLLTAGTAVYGQTAGQSLGTEIQNLEKTLTSTAGIPPVRRHETLSRLARLQQLSGNIEAAAKNWLAAATANPEKPDDNALVSGAACLASMGEWEQVAAVIRPILRQAKQGPALLRARYLDACAAAWVRADFSALNALAENPGSAELKPSVYYTLWRITAGNTGAPSNSAESWKARLLAEYPQSPEGRIAAAEEGSRQIISARPGPIWLLMPGRSSLTFETAAPAAPSAPPASPSRPGSTASSPPPASPGTAANTAAHAAPAAPVPAASGPALQTGLFSREANARAQADRLKSAGFSPALVRRTVNGAEYWAVTVPAGQDTSRTILELKNAGFESFPLN